MQPDTTQAAAPDGQLLSYALEPGTTFSYEVELDQHIEMTAEGDPSAMGDEELPGNANIDMSGTATFTQSIAEGIEPDTYEVTIVGDFSDITFTGTVDGETIEELPDFAGLDPIDVTFLIDEKGRVIYDDEVIGDPFAGALGDMGALGSGAAPGMDPGQFVGPLLPDVEVTVGDTWSEEIEVPLFGDDPIVTTFEGEVTGTDTIDGHEVFVIESSTVTSPIEIDLGEFFLGFFLAFAPDESSPEYEEFQAMIDGFRFVMSIDGARSESTAWFDAEAGVARQFDLSSEGVVAMDINLPDEETGELAGLVMVMELDQSISYRLLGTEGA